jgi:PAS domain S-box-containing protein
MPDSATAKKLTRPGASFARRYGVAFASVAGALLLDLLFNHFNLPHPFAAFALSGIAITFWYGGTKPGIVAVLLSSLIRGFIVEGPTSNLSRALYNLVFLLFAALMIWVRRSKDALEVTVADRTARLTTANDEFRSEKEQLDGLFELSPDAVIVTNEDFYVLRVNKEFTRMFGYTVEEAAGQWLPELIVPEELRAQSLKNRDALISGKRVELETVRQRKGGVRFDVSVVAKSISLGFEQGAVYLIYRDISERKKVEREIRRSEGYLAEAQKLTHTGSWAWNVRTDVLFWSREIFSIYDYEYQEMGPTWPQFLERVHPEDRPRIEQRAKMEASGKEWLDSENDFRIILPDGTIKHLHSVAHPVRDDLGEVTEVVGTVMDVTAQRKARAELERAFEEIKQRTEALQRSEGYLAEAQKLTHTGSWAVQVPQIENAQREAGQELSVLHRFGWNSSYWSKEMYQIFGFDPGPTPPPYMEVGQRLHPDDARSYTRVVEQAIRDKTDFEANYRLFPPNGGAKYIHVVGHPVANASGDVIEFVGTAMDVTEQHEARAALQAAFEQIKAEETELRQSEADLHEAQRLSHTGSWKHNISSGTVTVSPEVYRIFGVTADEDPSAVEFWLNRNHPEDEKRIRELFQRSEIQKTDYQADYRIVLPGGAIKYLHAIGHPVLNDSGDLVEYVGTVMDVTAAKQAEEKIRQSERELRQLIDLTPLHITEFGPDGTSLYINQAALDYHGLTLQEWRSADLDRLFHPQDAERMRREHAAKFRGGSPYELEVRLRRKDGQYRWFAFRYNPVRDEQGHLKRWYAAASDIEDRKQAEQRLHDENVNLREEIDRAFMFEEIVGASPALQNVLSSIVKVAPTDSTVLITGETGTGKELIARAIHKHSQRSGQAFISVNCASIPSSLIASELFGHERGAFTGAVQRRQGRFEMAHSGTIFLDEVGELPAETQIALLRVLQERQFERVGGNRIIPTDVRVIAATNRDLTEAIAAGTFRADLFYRLNVFPIEVPPLRKRKEDIPMLVEYFVKRYAEKTGKQISKIDNNTLELCQSYPWPGNIRELQNIVERSVILCGGDTFWIEKAWLARVHSRRQELAGPLPDTLQNQEKQIIEAALAESRGKVAGPEGAAAKLGIPRSTLDSKIKQLNISKQKFVTH